MIKLHYAPLVLDGDIPCYEFERFKDLLQYVKDMLKDAEETKPPIVYLLTCDLIECLINDDNDNESEGESDEIFITDNSHILCIILESLRFKLGFEVSDSIYIQEYASYEEAYKAALDMKETSPLCYPKD